MMTDPLAGFGTLRIGSASGNYLPTIDHNKPVYIEESNASRRRQVQLLVFFVSGVHVHVKMLFSDLEVMYMVNNDLEGT